MSTTETTAVDDAAERSPRPALGVTTGFETKDSGLRGEYASGMEREPDHGRPRFDLLLPLTVPYDHQLLTRAAALMERGARKYSSRNWERADSLPELERMKASAFRHFMQWMTGEDDEDHAAAVIFNLLAAETTAYRIDQGDHP